MTVNFEIKGMLARLLATEDLMVEHKKVETACFNVHTRVLTLPLWDKATNVVYDMLVAHEVSHALYTPDRDMTSLGVPHQFINITEDARVEKLVKRRYMGLAKTFYGAYKELQEQDFFNLEHEDIFLMNLADRANLWFKVGNYINVPIKLGEEMEIINLIADAETFDETVDAAKKLYEYCKRDQEQEKSELPEVDSNKSTSSGASQSSSAEGDVEEESGGAPNDGQNSLGDSMQSGSDPSPISEESEEPEVKTVDSLEKSIQSLATNFGYENVYVELPSLNLESVVVKNALIHSYIEEHYREQQVFYDEESSYESITGKTNIFQRPDLEYHKFKKSAQKEVNYLVKEFECKKAANSYARATTARTGVLDCSKLHTYNFNEDIFRKVTTLSEGKNHGLVFILDWSGSMANVMLDTIKQLYNLVWFCKKVSIPFEVYAFTCDWMRVSYDENGQPIFPKQHYTKKAGLLLVDERFHLLNILTSNVNAKTLENQLINLWRTVYTFRGSDVRYKYPPRLVLSGTPLNETMIALHNLIPHFQDRTKVQKVQCVILTDGEASPLTYHVHCQRNPETEPYIGNRRIHPETTFIRDRKLGTTYKIGYEQYEFTDALIQNIRDKFSDVNFICIRIMSKGVEATTLIRRYCGYHGDVYDKTMTSWKKDRGFNITNSPYTGYFGMSSSFLSHDTEFEVSDDATKTQIKSAFVKSLKTKKLNKKILGEFVELIV